MNISYKVASICPEFADGKNLFHLYANTLIIDLSFQNLINELKTIAIQFDKPEGALLLANNGNIAVGCSGIRELDIGKSELKRIFVRKEYRRYKIEQKLVELSLDIARILNYSIIRLDSLPGMTEAQNLYHTFGFYEIPSYRFNPIKGTVYMEKNLI